MSEPKPPKKEKPGRRPFNDGKKKSPGFVPTGGKRPVKEFRMNDDGSRRVPRGPSAGADRPRRSFGDRETPAGFGGGYRQPRGGEEGGERRPPRRDFGDRPARGPSRDFGDRPIRRGFGESRTRDGGESRTRDGGESRTRDGGDRPARPARDFGDRPTRAPRDGDDRPFRSGPRFTREGGEGRPMRRSAGSFDRDSGPRYQAQNDEVPDGELPFRPHVEKGEIYYHGRNACEAIYKQRSQDIIRVYVKRELAAEFKDLLNFCSSQRLAFHLVGDGDLERLTDTKHHDGICILAREKRFTNEKDLMRGIGGGRTLVMYLDGVGNPHNLGAILRTASHFGVKYVAGADEELPRISPAANRTSEGGAEHVELVRVEEAETFLDRLQSSGFQVYAFENSPKAISLFDITLNEKACFVMGAEVTGLSNVVKSSADVLVKIPGTGNVESLNVSVAAALAMAEFTRQGTAARTVRIVKKK